MKILLDLIFFLETLKSQCLVHRPPVIGELKSFKTVEWLFSPGDHLWCEFCLWFCDGGTEIASFSDPV